MDLAPFLIVHVSSRILQLGNALAVILQSDACMSAFMQVGDKINEANKPSTSKRMDIQNDQTSAVSPEYPYLMRSPRTSVTELSRGVHEIQTKPGMLDAMHLTISVFAAVPKIGVVLTNAPVNKMGFNMTLTGVLLSAITDTLGAHVMKAAVMRLELEDMTREASPIRSTSFRPKQASQPPSSRLWGRTLLHNVPPATVQHLLRRDANSLLRRTFKSWQVCAACA